MTRTLLGQVMTSSPCPGCQGYGTVIVTPCKDCSGEGRTRAGKTAPRAAAVMGTRSSV